MALVRAARQLKVEIESLFPDADVEVLDERDGLGFQREVRIDNDTVKAMGEAVVGALLDDSRIAEAVRSGKGLRVVFVSTTQADFDRPFDLASVIPAD